MVGKRTILINNKEVPIRSYEVSIWTLQDSFITVLKWANIDNKGQIQEPKMVLDVDGTQNFSFSIPMYLKTGEENPAWYNTLNGNLMIGMRKIKVILNKKLEDEAVFEFLITKVTEKHEAGTLFCDVECEGLAFHELGKVGYKVTLSGDEYDAQHNDWWENGQEGEEPINNINYWNEKTNFLESYEKNKDKIIPNKWYYKIEMDWSAYNSNLGRESNIVYEDEYVASWEIGQSSQVLEPVEVQAAREKFRHVEVKESNIYNATQKIAEAFGVFCKYKYEYDDNYHIISRMVIYYNNFIEEQSGYMDLTYPYHTSEITREMDSTELTTKLFVRPVDQQTAAADEINIMSVDANKSREDYLLNFEYLHKFNIITDEQYEAIDIYERQMHFLNIQLETLAPQIQNLERLINDYKAKLAVAENGIEESEKQANIAKDKVHLFGDQPIHIDQGAPKSVMVLTDEKTNRKYVKMPFVGIIPGTVQLYDGIIDYTKQEKQLENENTVLITGGTFEFESQAHDLVRISNLPDTIVKKVKGQDTTVELGRSLWLVCDYYPYTYWIKIQAYWEQARKNIERQITEYEEKITDFENKKEAKEIQYKQLLNDKDKIIKEFEEMMGPALREGYWQPENYEDYGNRYFISNLDKTPEQGVVKYFFCDNQCFIDNDKITYYEGQEQKTFLVINLGICSPSNESLNTKINYINECGKDLCFIYYDFQSLNQSLTDELLPEQKQNYLRNALRVIHVDNSTCRFAFIRQSEVDTIYFALVIEESKTMLDEQISFFKREGGYADSKYNKYFSKIGTIAVSSDGNFSVNNGAIDIASDMYLNNNISQVYPRIIIDSLKLKTDDKSLHIKLDNILLEQYKDYNFYVETDMHDSLDKQHQKYMIDIKPTAIIKTGKSHPSVSLAYKLSNADTLIYLDALQVSKENAEPKVSYTIKLSLYDPYIIYNIYKKLSKIVHINDIQLKFENVQGYISHIEMLLDQPWEDSIEIKNYKTKFEDLFSNIVAQTDAMQKKSHSYDVASLAFTSEGVLTEDSVKKMLDEHSITFSTYIDDYLTDNPIIKSALTSIFNEAGSILSSAGNALADLRAVTDANAEVLAGFVRGADEGFNRGIDLISSEEGNYTSAVQINNQGIFIGSDQKISLYSGKIGDNTAGVSIDMNPNRLILGASSNSNSTAAKFTDKYLVLAAGDVIQDSEKGTYNLDTLSVTGTINGLVGAKFTSDSFGLATYKNSTINAVLMNEKGITLGSGIVEPVETQNRKVGIDLNANTSTLRNNNYAVTGASYVRISGNGIDIGSGGELYVDTSNFVVKSNAGIGENIFELKKLGTNGSYETALKYSLSDGLSIKGTITANELYIIDNDETKEATDWVKAKVTPDAIWLGVKARTASDYSTDPTKLTSISLTNNSIDIKSAGNLNIKSSGNFTIESGGNIDITSSNFIVNSQATNGETIFQAGGSNEYIKYISAKTENGTTITAHLEVKGNIIADTGAIGGWNIGNNLLSSGNGGNYVGLDSNTSNSYAIWAGKQEPDDIYTGAKITTRGAPFRVTRNGRVYMDKLMLWDSEKEIYTEVDFSDFKQAAALTLKCSGTEISAKATYWGKFSSTKNSSTTASVNSLTIADGQADGYGTTSITINCGDIGSLLFENVNVNATAISSSTRRSIFNYVNSIFNTNKYSSGSNQFYDYTNLSNSQSGSGYSLQGSYKTISAAVSAQIIGTIVRSYGKALVSSTEVDTSDALDTDCSSIYDAGLDEGYESGYTAGWNAALDACTGHTCYTGGTYYSTLYVAPTLGATSVSNCRAGQSQQTYYSLPNRR